MTAPTRQQQAATLDKDWATNPRWKGIQRGYSADDVVRLRGSLQIEHTLAKRGAEKLWPRWMPFQRGLVAQSLSRVAACCWRVGAVMQGS